MPGVPVPFASARVDLGPALAFPQVLAALAVLGGFVALLVWLYRLELRRIRPRTARVLLGLRVAAFAAVFLVFAGRPAVVRAVREPVPGRVLVAVDVSDSMRVTDPDRPLAEKLRVARALRLHDGVTTDGQLDEWIADADRSGVPHHPPPDTPAGAARRAVFEEVVHRADALTHLQAAERLLAPDGAALLDRLRKSHAVEVVGFGQTLADLPADPDGLRAALAGRSPAAAFTDLKLPLARAATDRGDGALLGVVLLTDGRHNWGEPPTAKPFRAAGVPVFPVNVAPRDPPADVAIVSVRPAVATACRGASVPVEVRVRVTRWPADRVRVELHPPDGRPPLAHTLRHDGPDREYEVTFHPRFDRPGVQALTAVARPERPDHRPDNNTRSARVSAVEYRPRVLLVDGETRWEFRYLRSALERSKDPELEVVAPGPPAELADEDPLAGFDCVMLGDVTDEQLPPKDRERLERYVADAGGTLVVVAGKRFVPVGLTETASDADPLRKLLPITDPRAFAPEDGFRPEFTPEGRRAWFLRLSDTPEQDREVWEGLPPHGWAAVGTARDGAEVLAWVDRPEAGLTGAEDRPERSAALVARQHYGFGRVLYVGLESTWRWRFKAGEGHHHRFWKQVVQWAAADRLLPAGNAAGTVRFGTREPTYPASREVEFVLRATETVPTPGPNAVKAVKLVREDGTGEVLVGLVPLRSPDDRPRELTARFRDLPPGRYAVEPEVPEWADHLRPAPGGAARPRATFVVLPPESEESSDLAANLPLLEGLAKESGGRVFDLAAAGGLADVLAARAAVKEYEASTPLRRSWWTLAVVALLLTAEWVTRKLSGLA